MGKEPQKAGVMPEELADFLREFPFPHLKVKGLVALLPIPKDSCFFFQEMRRLFEAFS